MANFLNFFETITTNAPMSTLIDQSRVIADTLESGFRSSGGTPPPTMGQLFPRGIPG
jgi:hypothetical protein